MAASRRLMSRRDFLYRGACASALMVARPAAAESEAGILFKNGNVVDGTGRAPFVGDVLVKESRIEDVSESPIDIKCAVIDCAGKVIAPGFIDAHSHMDWILPIRGRDDLKAPFIAQGCTTFVAGNCGYGAAGFRPNSAFKEAIIPGLFSEAKLEWDTVAQYFDCVRAGGLSHNLALFAGHGTTRTSIKGFDPGPLSPDEMNEMLALLARAMDEGAPGVSLGLQYAPGLFAPLDELKQVARLVKSKDKILSVHGRAYSWLSAEYPFELFGPPHNLLAIREMLDIARETGVRLQYSHLIFAGEKTHENYAVCLKEIEQAIAQGVDVQFDSYPYHCGNSVLGVVIPAWFRENIDQNIKDPKALKRLETELMALSTLVGLSYNDMQITAANHEELSQYDGLFLSEIARMRNKSPFETFVEFAQKCGDRGARVLLHKYSNMEIIDALMAHPACLYMTDASPGAPSRNPGAYGAFPLFLQYARERKKVSLEQAVRKMSGAVADRFRLKGRGYIQKGMAADITVFDWNTVRDNTTVHEYNNAPSGIDHVFVNGRQAVKDGHVGEISFGQVL